MPELAALVMAAGKGTRMKSKLPKVMHCLAGRPLIDHVLTTVRQAGAARIFTVLGHEREIVAEHIAGQAQVVIQAEQLGTGHAVMQAMPFLQEWDTVLVVSGDQPLLRPETLRKLINLHLNRRAAATVLTAELADPFGYGRVLKDHTGQLREIVEEKDASPEERQIREINTGTYCFQVGLLREALATITPKNAQGEYYLTDVFSIMLGHGNGVAVYCMPDAGEALGINSRGQLAEAEGIFRQRINLAWMDAGVTIVDPASTFIDAGVQLASDVTILPFTFLRGTTQIAADCVIGPQVTLDSCVCGAGSEVTHTVGKEAVIGSGCTVGPFAYLRPGTVLEDRVKVGDFVEIKNSRIGVGSKVPHLSYIGDAQVGRAVNIGAGTITCNYDGVKKHATVIGDNAFIGSNTNLVAPVEIGAGALTGAGSTITKNVPPQALVVERSQQVVKQDWQQRKLK